MVSGDQAADGGSGAGSDSQGRDEGSNADWASAVDVQEDDRSGRSVSEGTTQRTSTRGSERFGGAVGEGFKDGRAEDPVQCCAELRGNERDLEWGQGIIWFLGTEGGRVEFENPADKGLVRVSSSSPWSRGRPENVCGRQGLPSHADKEQDSWVCIELPRHCSLLPTGYAVRHGLQGSGRVLTDWTLLGSRDGFSWIPLKVHRQDLRLAVRVREAEGRARMSGSKAVSGYEGAYFSITGGEAPTGDGPNGDLADQETMAELERERAASARVQADLEVNGGLRFLQIQADGKDSSGLWTLACCGLEFFGKLMVDRGAMVADVYRLRGMAQRRVKTIAMLRAVGERGDEDMVWALHSAYVDDDGEDVRNNAAEALRRLGDAPQLELHMAGGGLTLWQGDDADGLVESEVSGSPPLQLSVSPALPRGLMLDPASGEIYGTALSPAPKTTHTITAQNLSGSVTAQIDIMVLPKALPVGVTFEFREDFDRLGLMHFLSTAGARAPWSNPAQSGLVKLETSGWLTDLHYVVGDGGRISTSFAHAHSWFSLELPPGLWVLPSRYSLRHGFSSSSHALRSWDLLGSVDGIEWVVLRRHADDHSLDGRFAEATWALGAVGRPVRWFKVQITGANSSHTFELRCAGFEVYGEVFMDLPIRATESPVWYMRKWGVESLVMAVAHEQAEEAYFKSGGRNMHVYDAASKQKSEAIEDGTESAAPERALEPELEQERDQEPEPQFEMNPSQWKEALRRLDEEVGLECGDFTERLIELCADPDMELQLLALSVLPLFAERGDEGAIRAGFAGLGSDKKVVRVASNALIERVAKPGDKDTFAAALDHVVDAILTARSRNLKAGRRGSRQTGASSLKSVPQHSAPGLNGVLIPPVPAGRPFRQSPTEPAPQGRRASLVGCAGGPAADPEAEAVLVAAYVDGLGLMVGEEDGGALLEILGCCQRVVRGGASADGADWRSIMLPHLSKPQWYVRSTIARLLPCVAQRGDDPSTDAALALLKDSESAVRVQAARTLAKVARAGDSRIVMKLQQRLGDEEHQVRMAVAQTLGQLSGLDPVGQAIDTITLAQIGVDPEVRPRVDAKAKSLLMEMGGSLPGQQGDRRSSIDNIMGAQRPPLRPGTGAASASVEAFLQMHTHTARPHVPPWVNAP